MKSDIADCAIDDYGTYKYIQILITNKKDSNDKKVVIRGSDNFSFHKEIFRSFIDEISKEQNENFTFECIGGGRIEKNSGSILVYGYSTVYGQAEHKLTVEILKKYYPNEKIEYSYSGY